MGTARRLVHIVRRHDFIPKPFPEVFEGIIYAGTLEDIDILYYYFVCEWIHFHLQTIAFA